MDLNTGKYLNDSLSQDLKLLITTPKGERLLNRDYGSNVEDALALGVNKVFEICSQILVDLKQASFDVKTVKPLATSNFKQGKLELEINLNNNQTVNVEL